MLEAIELFSDLQELSSEWDGFLVFAGSVKLDNLPAKRISLGCAALPVGRRKASGGPPCEVQKQNDCQCVA